jgi:hypothetical protein
MVDRLTEIQNSQNEVRNTLDGIMEAQKTDSVELAISVFLSQNSHLKQPSLPLYVSRLRCLFI